MIEVIKSWNDWWIDYWITHPTLLTLVAVASAVFVLSLGRRKR